jgi:CheY-like chemotaxis protein
LTQRLLAFSRRQPLEPKPIRADKLVRGMEDILRQSLGEAYQVETVGAGGLWMIEADPVQLESAILNLALNARDAMPDRGKITIETSNAFLDENYVRQHAGLAPGQYVQIAVSDTGSGMDAETIKQAFEPFFTTKPSGQGTGLGLSQIYGYVKQSGGHVKIYSEPGEGTTVKIYLPRLLDETKETSLQETGVSGMSTGEIILVVEDDEEVRTYVAEILRDLGYRVFHVGDAEAALELVHRENGRIDLILTDVVLPNKNGRMLADEATASYPAIRILFMTGYSRNAIVHQGRLDPGVALIQKPLTQADLAMKVREVLTGKSAAAAK